MTTQRDAWGERLPRHLGLGAAVAVLVGTTIGSGIFRVPATTAERLGDPGAILLAWVIGGALALAGALTLAELAAALPRSGGVFAYILEGFGPLPAFLFGWSELAVIRAAALGAIATIFAEYFGRFVALTPEQVHWVAAAAVFLVGLFNYVGVKTASVVLLFSFGMPLMPVDRHVERVARRVGLLPAKATPDQAHDYFLAMLEPDQMHEAHVNLIRHGRLICQAQRPKHELCPLRERCRFVDPKAP